MGQRLRVQRKGLAAVQTDEDRLCHCPHCVGMTEHMGHSFTTCILVS